MVVIDREEYFYISLSYHLDEDNVSIVFSSLLAAMFQSISLFKNYDFEPIEQRVSLYTTILNYICTRIEKKPLVEECMNTLETKLRATILDNMVLATENRFSPSFSATMMIYYDLCKIFNHLELFKEILYILFMRAGEFPIHTIYLLWRHDHNVFAEISLYDSIINCIIGNTLQKNLNDLQPFYDLTEYYQALNANWEETLVGIETSSLQCVINSEEFTTDKINLYTIAGKCLSLIYVYRGGEYAVQSLLENKIIERMDCLDLDEKYRLYLVYLLCKLAILSHNM